MIAALQGYSFAKLGSTYPSGGGMLTYLARGFGEGHITGIVSWLFYTTGAIVVAMIATSFGGYASAVVAGGDPTWATVLAVALVVVMTALNIVGSTAVARVQSLIVNVVLAILSLFAIVTIANWNPSLLDPAGYPGVQEIISSVALTFFAFLGFGVITFTAKDLPDPVATAAACHVPRARDRDDRLRRRVARRLRHAHRRPGRRVRHDRAGGGREAHARARPDTCSW